MCDLYFERGTFGFTVALPVYTFNQQLNATGSHPFSGAGKYCSGRGRKYGILLHQSERNSPIQLSDRISICEHTVPSKEGERERKTRSLLRSERFSSLSVYSWNFNLLHWRVEVGSRMSFAHTHTHVHTHILS